MMTLEVSLDAVDEAATIAGSAGTKVFLNPAPPPDEPLPGRILRRVDVLVPNIWEAQKLARSDEQDPGALALRLNRMGAKLACVTTSASGCVVARDGRVTPYSSEPSSTVDTTGGSDAFCAALAIGLTDGAKSCAAN